MSLRLCGDIKIIPIYLKLRRPVANVDHESLSLGDIIISQKDPRIIKGIRAKRAIITIMGYFEGFFTKEKPP